MIYTHIAIENFIIDALWVCMPQKSPKYRCEFIEHPDEIQMCRCSRTPSGCGAPEKIHQFSWENSRTFDWASSSPTVTNYRRVSLLVLTCLYHETCVIYPGMLRECWRMLVLTICVDTFVPENRVPQSARSSMWSNIFCRVSKICHDNWEFFSEGIVMIRIPNPTQLHLKIVFTTAWTELGVQCAVLVLQSPIAHIAGCSIPSIWKMVSSLVMLTRYNFSPWDVRKDTMYISTILLFGNYWWLNHHCPNGKISTHATGKTFGKNMLHMFV